MEVNVKMTKEQYKKGIEKMIEGTQAERIFLSNNSFGLFVLYYFRDYFKYSLAPYHYEMINDLETLTNGNDIKELAFIMFRESAKTTFSKLYLIWLIVCKKKLYINATSFDKENAERILFDVAFELSSNRRLINDFGLLFSRKKTQDDIKQTKISNFITENGIRVEAHSTQESMRGRIHLNQRPDFLLLDDFETNKTKDSAAYTKQIRDHISEALAGMDGSGAILYLGNYLTEYANVQFLLDRAKTDHKIKVLNIPVLNAEGKPTWGAKYCLTDEEAEITGKVSIESKKRQLGPHVFSYEMMNQPVDEAQAEFKKEWIQKVEEKDIEHMMFTTFITIDPAASKKDTADYTGVCINRVNKENKWYIKTQQLKMNSAELIDHIFYLVETYKPEIIGIEETVYTLAVQPFLEEAMAKRNKFFVITPLKHNGTNKEQRIRGLIPRMANKGIFFVGDNIALFNEMRVFPRGQNDDVLDSMAYQEQIAYKPYDSSILDVLDDTNKTLYSSIGV
jgi:phage terminase large subunit-like protein